MVTCHASIGPKESSIERTLNWMNVDQLNVCICAVMTSYPNNRASDLSRFSLQPRVGVPRAHAFMFCKVGCTVWFFGRIFDSSAGGSNFELEQSCCGNEQVINFSEFVGTSYLLGKFCLEAESLCDTYISKAEALQRRVRPFKRCPPLRGSSESRRRPAASQLTSNF